MTVEMVMDNKDATPPDPEDLEAMSFLPTLGKTKPWVKPPRKIDYYCVWFGGSKITKHWFDEEVLVGVGQTDHSTT